MRHEIITIVLLALALVLICLSGCRFIELKEPTEAQITIAKIAAREAGRNVADSEYAGDVRRLCEQILEIKATADADDVYVDTIATALFQYLEADPVTQANVRDILDLFDFKVHEDTGLYIMHLQTIAEAILEGMSYGK
jgi:hypothetical protein